MSMIKHVEVNSYTNKPFEVGYIQLIEWVNTEYKVPNNDGEYITSDGQGHTRILNFCSTNFNRIVFEEYGDRAVIWHTSGNEITAEELVDLIRLEPYVWYYWNYNENDEDIDYGEWCLIVMDKDDVKYWMDSNDIFHGVSEENTKNSPVHTTYSSDRPNSRYPTYFDYVYPYITYNKPAENPFKKQ